MGDDASGINRLGHLPRRQCDRVGDRWLRLIMAGIYNLPIDPVSFDFADNTIHHFNGRDGGIRPLQIGRQHDRIRRIVNRRRHIRGFRPCRGRTGDHRIQHLRRHHHRLSE